MEIFIMYVFVKLINFTIMHNILIINYYNSVIYISKTTI